MWINHTVEINIHQDILIDIKCVFVSHPIDCSVMQNVEVFGINSCWVKKKPTSVFEKEAEIEKPL